MNLDKLQNVKELLKGTNTFIWLVRELNRLVGEKDSPQILVVISSPSYFKKKFPEGLKIEEDWFELLPEDLPERMAYLAESSDLILWAMTALRLFPGEYKAVLATAKNENIPVLAIIAGLDNLSDPEHFIKNDLLDYKARLPDKSEILLYQKSNHVEIVDSVREFVSARGEMLANYGKKRRKEKVTVQLKSKLNQEQAELQLSLSQITKFLETAQCGIQYLGVMAGSEASVMIDWNNDLTRFIEELENGIFILLDAKSMQLSSDELKNELDDIFHNYGSQLENMMGQNIELSIKQCERWAVETSNQLYSFFHPFYDMIPGPSQLNDILTVNPGPLLSQLGKILSSLSNEVLQEYDAIRQRIEHDHWLAILRLLGKSLSLEELKKLDSDNNEEELKYSNDDSVGKQPKSIIGEEDQHSEESLNPVISFITRGEIARRKLELDQIKVLIAKENRLFKDQLVDIIKRKKQTLIGLLIQVQEERANSGFSLINPLIVSLQGKMNKIVEADERL